MIASLMAALTALAAGGAPQKTAGGLAASPPAPAGAAERASAKIDWARTAQAPGYEKATAHAPRFEDKSIWPVSGKAQFLKEKWAPGRLLVWAHPGQSANVKDRRAKLDVYNLKNWINAATGRPAGSFPDADTDILLPASETPYTVSWKKRDQEHFPITVRHLTVARNAQWYSSGLKLHGSIWLKRGGAMGNHGSLAPVGSRHTFFRNDNGDPSLPRRADGSNVSQYISFNRPRGSCEFLGDFSTGDEFRVFAGTFIIGRDSRVRPGRNASPFIEKPAKLVLLDGAALAKWCNQLAVTDLRVMGTLQGGLPDRPLTRDAFVGVSYQNTNGTKFYDNGLLSPPRNRSLESRVVPLLFLEGSRLMTYSRNVARATLVIGWSGVDAKDWHAAGLSFRRMDPKSQAYLVQQLDKLPKGITAAFVPGVEVDGVRFDWFLKGGLLLTDPSARRSWKRVTYGPHNKAAPDELYHKPGEISFKHGGYAP
jgi:hypothetical protein